MTAKIPVFSANTPAPEITDAIRQHGCAIVRELAGRELVDRIDAELAPYFDSAPMSNGAFMGRRTQRTCRIVVKSPAARDLILDRLVLDVVGAVLEGGAYHYTLHHTEAMRVHPGQGAQSIHRDDTTFPFKHPCKPVMIACFWALSRFTPANGATRVVPGSHLWDDERRPTDAEIQSVDMPPGSVLIIDAALYHSAGGNQTEDEVRRSVVFMYGLGWLRPAENPNLAVPPAVARTLPPQLQDLLSYRNHGYLGHYELASPKIVLADEVPDVVPAADLFDEFEHITVERR